MLSYAERAEAVATTKSHWSIIEFAANCAAQAGIELAKFVGRKIRRIRDVSRQQRLQAVCRHSWNHGQYDSVNGWTAPNVA